MFDSSVMAGSTLIQERGGKRSYSGRARWMRVVRWGSIDKTDGIGSVWCQGEDIHGGSRMMAGVILFPACQTRGLTLRFSGSMPCETCTSEPVRASSNPLELGVVVAPGHLPSGVCEREGHARVGNQRGGW